MGAYIKEVNGIGTQEIGSIIKVLLQLRQPEILEIEAA